MCISEYGGDWKTGKMEVCHTPDPKLKPFTFTFYAGVPDIIEVEADTEEEAYRLFHEELDGNVNCEQG